jgi:ATP-dependent Clp protease protease subunit
MKRLLLLILGTSLGAFIAYNLNRNNLPDIAESPRRTLEQPTAIAPTAPKIQQKVLEITNLNLKKGSVIVLADEVNFDTANAVIKGIRDANAKSTSKPIYLLLDSPGGSVIDGARIISEMQASQAPVYTVCVQLCASMAAMILEYGKERYAVDRSIIMFHPASVGALVQGELDKVVSRFSFLQRYVDKMDHHTAARAGQTYAEFKAKTSRELWIDAEDALAEKLIDAVVTLDSNTLNNMNLGNNRMRERIKLTW